MSSDYWILQYLIEKVTGGSYYDALKKYVLAPLQLTDTYVSNTEDGMVRMSDVLPKEATVYHYTPKTGKYRIGDFLFTKTGYTAGGLYTSITDFSKLALALDDHSFLSAASYQLLTQAYPLNNTKPGSFGLGFIVRPYQNHQLVEHSGGPALADFTRFEDEQLTIIVLTNQRGFYPYLSKGLATLYISGLEPPVVPENF